jgi:phosphocarrier protein
MAGSSEQAGRAPVGSQAAGELQGAGGWGGSSMAGAVALPDLQVSAPREGGDLAAMNGETLQHKIVVINQDGLHMRPATAFAELAKKFLSRVTVARDSKTVDGKSLLELLLLIAEQGTELTLEVSGPDAREALGSLVKLLTEWGVAAPPEPPLPQKG